MGTSASHCSGQIKSLDDDGSNTMDFPEFLELMNQKMFPTLLGQTGAPPLERWVVGAKAPGRLRRVSQQEHLRLYNNSVTGGNLGRDRN